MNNISLQDLLLLTYLSNYDIRIMYEVIASSEERDVVLGNCIRKLQLSDSGVKKAYEQTTISLDKLSYYNIQAIPYYDEKYPTTLRTIKDAPPILYIKGNYKEVPSVAVIGSRETSKFAQKITKQIIDWLFEKNYSIVSGLAKGIDTFAHDYANKNKQYNIAVLPNSLDSIYPKDNYKIANEILDSGGCLLSESIFNINRGKRSFVQRNRIQASLSEAVIPIEMGRNSGTMHTINFAKRYDKKIMVMKPTDMLKDLQQYSGINQLINSKHKNVQVFSSEVSFFECLASSNTKLDKIQTSLEL